MQYPALFHPDEGGFVVTFPDFDWGQGDTEQEALEMATDAVRPMMKGVGLPHPHSRRVRKYRLIRLPALQSAKVELYLEFFRSGMRKTELARRMGIPKTVVDRLFDLEHRSRLDQIEAAFRALGKEITISVRDAA